MDEVRLALGQVLLNPSRTKSVVAKAESVLGGFPAGEAHASLQFLRRARFLGAYRLWFESGKIVSGFDVWPLPDRQAGHLSWLWATPLVLGVPYTLKNNAPKAPIKTSKTHMGN